MASNPVIIPSDLESYQGGDPQLLIDQATADVRRYCGWHVTPSITETLTLDGSGNGTQILPSLHVTAVTSVTYDGTLLTADDDFIWSSDGVIEYAPRSLYFAGVSYWLRGFGKVVVVLTHGYADAPDFAGIIMALASRSKDNPNRLVRTQAGPFADQYEVGSGFTTSELATLDLYRLPPRP